MQLLRSALKHYAFIGIRPSNQLTQTQKYPFNGRILVGFILFGCIGVSQFVYIFYVANGVMEYLESIASTSSSIIEFVCFAAIVFRRTLFFHSIDNIEKLVDSRCKNRKSKKFFTKSGQRIDRLDKIVFTWVMKIPIHLFMLPKSIVIFAIYFLTDSGNDSFELPMPMWFPFETTNPIGYLMAVILEYILIGFKFFIVTCTLCLGIGAFCFAISMTKEIQRILQSINKKGHANKNQLGEFKTLLPDYVETHGLLKQLGHDFSNILQPIIMSLFTWSLLAISGAFLIIQVEILRHGNAAPVLRNGTLDGILAIAIVFIACELGHHLNDAFEEISSTIDRFDWYLFPIEMKRLLPMIIKISQQSVELECFGSISCTRDVFKNIIRHAFSYFMVLRSLGD